MATKPETQFRKKVRNDLKALAREYEGRLWYEPIQQKAIKGSPDYILCANGCFIGLELKAEDGIVSKIQESKMKAILEAGGLALVADPKNWHSTLSTIAFYLQGESDDCNGTHEVS
jgi:hypothetical protein